MKKLISITSFLAVFFLTACVSDNDNQEPLKIRFDESSVTLKIDEQYTLQPIVESGNIVMEDAVWNSLDPKVAKVTNGVITARALGKTTIFLIYKDYMYASCDVTVEPDELTGITFHTHNVNLIINKDKTFNLNVSIQPKNAVVDDFEWEISSTDFISFNPVFEGKVAVLRPIAIGKTTIKVTAKGTSISDECVVNVLPNPVTGITCTENVSILLDEYKQLEAIVTPDNASDKSIIWESLNPDIATVDADGIVYGKATGTTQIIAKTNDGGFEAKCQVNVCEIDKFVTAYSSFSIEGSTNTGFYTYLTLVLYTDLRDVTITPPLNITSILLLDENDYVMGGGHMNMDCYYFTKKYSVGYYFATGEWHPNELNPLGWKFKITYIWNNKQYEFVHIHQ